MSNIVLIFGEDDAAMRAFGETLTQSEPGAEIGYRFTNQLLPNHIEDVKAVYMLHDYPAVREAYGEKAVMAEKKPEKTLKKVAE